MISDLVETSTRPAASNWQHVGQSTRAIACITLWRIPLLIGDKIGSTVDAVAVDGWVDESVFLILHSEII